MSASADPALRTVPAPTIADLSDPGVRSSYQRHRWLIFFMGLGSGLLGVLLGAGVRRSLEETGDNALSALCLLFLVLILVLIAAGALFLISFLLAVIFGLIGRGKSPWMRLLGVAPVVAVFGGFIAGPLLSGETGLNDGEQGAGFAAFGFWFGVALICLHAALLVPREHGEARWGCIAAALLPPLSLLAVALADIDSSSRALWALFVPLIATGFAGIIIFVVSGVVLAKYPIAQVEGEPPWERMQRGG